MDVILSVRLAEDDLNRLKAIAGRYTTVSSTIVAVVTPFLSGERLLPSKSKGRERQTTCTVDSDLKEALITIANAHGLSTNEALQFMVSQFIKEHE